MRHLWLSMVLVAATTHAAVVEDFESSPALNLYKAEERGATCTIEPAPAGGHGKAAKIAWSAERGGFLEVYYTRDVVLGTTAGELRLKIYTDTPNAVRLVAVRVKDQKSEIFHFDTAVKVEPKIWQEIVIPVKPGAHRGSWGGGKTGHMDGPLRLTGYGFVINQPSPAGALWIDDVAWEPTARTEPVAPTPAVVLSEALGNYNLDDAKLLEPFWRSTTITGESTLFVQENGDAPADGKLLFAPEKILRVRSARGDVVYEAGKDFTVYTAGRRLVRTADSRIPFLLRQDFYKRKDEKQAIKFKVGDPDTWLLWMENGFHGQQVEVDYVRAKAWTGYVPAFAGDALGSVIGKLRRKEPIRLVVTGDSISAGANASSKGAPPHMPSYPILLARQLELTYGTTVELINVAKGGATTEGGLLNIQKVVVAKPDLVIIAYGMNDVAARNPTRYVQNVQRMIDTVRTNTPAQFILVATSRANPEWSWTPVDEFVKYRDALAALCGPDVVLVDATSLWSQMLDRKRYHDLTGNGVNHPNDFGHRLYAQLLLSLLVK